MVRVRVRVRIRVRVRMRVRVGVRVRVRARVRARVRVRVRVRVRLLGEVGPDPALLGKVEVAQVLALLQIVEHELGHLKDTIARGVWLGGQG